MLVFLFAIFCTFFGSIICQQNPSTICPDAEYISPCTCSKACDVCEARVVCSNILNIDQLNDIFRRSKDYIFYHFQIVNSSFMFLPSDAIVEKRVRKLYLRNNVMSHLFDKPPPASNLLIELELSDLVLQSGVKWDVFSSLVHLQILNLTSFEIRKIDKSFIANFPPGLTGLFFTNTKTRDITDDAFSQLTELSRIFVHNTEIKTLKRSMFPAVSKLVAMHFTGNQISSLPNDIFTNMPDLAGVGFSKSKIITLQQSVFGNIMPQLALLYMEGNDIDCGCEMKWITKLAVLPYYLKVVCTKPTAVTGLSIKELKPSHFVHCE